MIKLQTAVLVGMVNAAKVPQHRTLQLYFRENLLFEKWAGLSLSPAWTVTTIDCRIVDQQMVNSNFVRSYCFI